MLIISRKPGESIIINDEIEVFILDAQKDKIRIGVNAPKDIKVLRKELYDTEKANREASQSANRLKYKELKNFMEVAEND